MTFDEEFKTGIQKSENFRLYTNMFDVTPDTKTDEKTIHWIQARPFSTEFFGAKPYLIYAGSNYKIIPDALYSRAWEDRSIDLIAFEACGSIENFWGKRGRYTPIHSALLLSVNKSWLKFEIPYKNTKKKISELMHVTDADVADMYFFTRSISIVYVLPDDEMESMQYKITPNSYEFFMSRSDFVKDKRHAKNQLKQFDWKNRIFWG